MMSKMKRDKHHPIERLEAERSAWIKKMRSADSGQLEVVGRHLERIGREIVRLEGGQL